MRLGFLVPCALAAILCAGVRAAEAPKDGDKKPDAPKEAPKEAPKDPRELSFTGHLVTSAVLVGAGSVDSRPIATLKYRADEKGPEQRVQLFATGDVAKEIKELAKKRGVTVEVTGLPAPDGSGLNVTKVKQVEEKKR